MTKAIVRRPPMQDVRRKAPFTMVRDAAPDDGPPGAGDLLDGYAAVFGEPGTVIRDSVREFP